MAWRKSWSQQNLEPQGTKRRLAPTHRSVWDDLLDLAETRHDGGEVAAFAGIGFSMEQLADIFHTPASDVKDAMEQFKKHDMIAVKANGIIVIKNYAKYQGDGDRVMQWRRKQKT